MYVRAQWIFFFATLVSIALAITYVVRPGVRRGPRAPSPYMVLFTLLVSLKYLVEPRPAKLALIASMFATLGAMVAVLVQQRRARART